MQHLRCGPLRAGELAEALGSTPAGISRHLRILRQSGLVSEQVHPDDARVRMVHLEPERFEQIRCWVRDVEAFWTDQLASFKAHAEATRQARRAEPATRGRQGRRKTTRGHGSRKAIRGRAR